MSSPMYITHPLKNLEITWQLLTESFDREHQYLLRFNHLFTDGRAAHSLYLLFKKLLAELSG